MVLVTVVAGVTAFAVVRLYAFAEGRQGARLSLQMLRTKTAILSQLEWQAVAERGVSDVLAGRVQKSLTDAQLSSGKAMGELGSGTGMLAVERELAAYQSAIRTEFSLLAQGDLEAAERLDEARVDPTFERLWSRIDASQAISDRQARRAESIARRGMIFALVLGLILVGALMLRLASATRATREAFFDPLTGLANRMLLADRLTVALRLAERTGERVAVLFFDLDDFKRVNDTLGHAAGDTLLKAVAERLGETGRASDTLGRLGGDEFVLVLSGAVDDVSAQAAAARVLDQLAEPFVIAGHQVVVTASIGCAVSEYDTSSDELLRNADLAMYASKRQGKRCVVVYEPSMYEALSDRLRLESDLREALARNEISLAYQPIVEVETGRLQSMEALARWTHPVRGAVSPTLFIPLAEETGMIQEIGRFVLLEATQQLRRWQTEHTLIPPIGVAVNVSPVQLQSGRIVDDVREALRASGIDPSTLTLEITESVLVERGDNFASALGALDELGVRLAVDDFGTGYSSLASLAQFPIDTLKIDRSFIENVTDDAGGLEMVRSILELGRALGLDAVAEGIETGGQAEVLRALDCDYGQGYHFAYPLTIDTVEDFVALHAAPLEPLSARHGAAGRVRKAPRIQPDTT